MNLRTIKEEMISEGLREIVDSLAFTIGRVRSKEASYQQGSVEVAAHKHVLQAVALDWMFNKKVKAIERVRNHIK